MNVGKYRTIIIVTYLFITVDLLFNTLSTVTHIHNEHELLIYVIQDVLQVFAIFMMFLLLFNTYVFQAGLVGLLLSIYKAPIIISIFYLGLSIPLHTFFLKRRWDDPYVYMWDDSLLALFIFHRLTGVLHYYFFKRMVFTLSDPKYYSDSSWLREEMNKRK
uniref:Transmembrane protein 138 n=1 Tax=Scolopendra viridis TaxID=118503 RepID=A0A4D5RA73_SCOVI